MICVIFVQTPQPCREAAGARAVPEREVRYPSVRSSNPYRLRYFWGSHGLWVILGLKQLSRYIAVILALPIYMAGV